MIFKGTARASEPRGDGVIDWALAATEPRRAQDSVRDEALGRADRVRQRHAAREARRDPRGERTARAVRRVGFDARGDESFYLAPVVEQVERVAAHVPALDEYGARAHLAQRARGLQHPSLVTNTEARQRLCLRYVRRQQSRERQQFPF